VHKFHTFEHRLGSHPRPGEQGKNPKKYGANAPQLHHIRCYIDFYVMLCNEQGKNPKNAAQTRHSCTISPCVLADSAINHPAGLAESGVGGSAAVAS